MAVDIFLNINKNAIKGESQDKTHKDTVDVLAYSFGASNSGTTHMGGGSGAGKANFQDLSITKFVDVSSVHLMTHVANGKHIPEAKLIVRKAGGSPLEYILFTMKDVIVTSVSMGGSGGEDRLTENVSLNFGSFEYQYVEQKADGSEGAKPMLKWDIAANATM